MPVYSAGTEIKPAEIARKGLEEARKTNVNVVIMDTAGRFQVIIYATKILKIILLSMN